MPTVRITSAVFDGSSPATGLLNTEQYLPIRTEAYRVVSFRISLFLDQIAAADITSQITFRSQVGNVIETLIFAPEIEAGGIIAWDYPCDLISPRATNIGIVVNNGAALPGDALLVWDFQITAPTRGGIGG